MVQANQSAMALQLTNNHRWLCNFDAGDTGHNARIKRVEQGTVSHQSEKQPIQEQESQSAWREIVAFVKNRLW